MNNPAVFALVMSAFFFTTCREVDDMNPNQPPVARAGEDVTAVAGQPLILDASASSDPDGDSLVFDWQWLAMPAQSGVEFTHIDSVRTSFTPDLEGLYTVILRVSDNIATSADTLYVTSLKPNGGPIANAGNDGQANLGVQYQLTGSGTDPDNDALTYQWTVVTKPAGSGVVLPNITTPTTSFTPDRPGSFTMRLTVSDGTSADTDDVVITTNPVNVTAINPTSGRHGITVRITGTNFSNVVDENQVRFNGQAAVVISAGYTSLDVVVPEGSGSGIVSVTVNGITDNGPAFTYLLTPTASTLEQFNAPFFLTGDQAGNIYISDYISHVIRRLTPAGELSIIAGSGNAGYADNTQPLSASFNHPAGIAVDNSNIYVADNGNHCIRVISLATGQVSTLAGFPQAGYADAIGGQAQFNSPNGLAIDASGNLYVGDLGNNRIRRVTQQGVVSTVAGNGQAGFANGSPQVAQFNGIAGVAVDANNNIYVADGLNQRIRRIDGQGTVSTLAGNGEPGFVNGTGTAAQFNIPYSVSCDASGNVYVGDFNNHSIRRVTPQGSVSTTAGNGSAGYADGAGAAIRFNQPVGVWVHSDGSIYVSDFGNQRVRLIEFE